MKEKDIPEVDRMLQRQREREENLGYIAQVLGNDVRAMINNRVHPDEVSDDQLHSVVDDENELGSAAELARIEGFTSREILHKILADEEYPTVNPEYLEETAGYRAAIKRIRGFLNISIKEAEKGD